MIRNHEGYGHGEPRGGKFHAYDKTARGAVTSSLFDTNTGGPRNTGTLAEATSDLGVEPSAAILVDVAPAGILAGREAGFDLLIGVARNLGTLEDLRQAGADMVVADLQELLDSAQASTAERDAWSELTMSEQGQLTQRQARRARNP
jgi:hypothetical protein